MEQELIHDVAQDFLCHAKVHAMQDSNGDLVNRETRATKQRANKTATCPLTLEKLAWGNPVGPPGG
jgi:hypothetical protein